MESRLQRCQRPVSIATTMDMNSHRNWSSLAIMAPVLRATHRRAVGSRYTERGHAKAFTLVEAMVVVGVIAVLLAITLPALHSARIRSHEAIALSNMRG